MYFAIGGTLSLILFVVGLYGVMVSKVGIKMLVSIEIMINAGILNLLLVAAGSMDAIVLALFVIGIAAVESVVGVSLLVAIYRKFGKINVSLLSTLRE